jgi:thiol-disulfide isomerase/thioredoxin
MKLFVLSIAVLLVLLSGFSVQAQVPELPAPDGSSDTPEITVNTIDKKRIKLSSLHGKVVMLDFFWTKCPHCQHHAPQIAMLYNKNRDRGLVIVGLAKDDEDHVGDIKKFIRDYGITYPIGHLTTELIAYFADTTAGVPQMVIFGTNGKMTMRRTSWTDEIAREIEGEIARQLKKADAK